MCDLQVRSQDLEVQFAATTAELQQLKGKQKTLEARNLLLEKLVQLSKQQQQPASDLAAQSNVSSFPDVIGQCGLSSTQQLICACVNKTNLVLTRRLLM